jgi:hypothetical protein
MSNEPAGFNMNAIWEILFGICLIIACIAGVVAAISVMAGGWDIAARSGVSWSS